MQGDAGQLLTLISGLQGALNACDSTEIVRLLNEKKQLWEIPKGHDREWDEYADLLVRIAQARLPGTKHSIQHAVTNLSWMPRSDPEAKLQRDSKLLFAADQFIAVDEEDLVHYIDSIRRLNRPSPEVLSWLNRIKRREIHPHVSRDMAEGVHMAYLATPRSNPQMPFMDWEASWPVLTAKLHGKHDYVRTYAARLLGDWYIGFHDLTDESCKCSDGGDCECQTQTREALRPTFKDMLDHITAIELVYPGVAGAFLTPFAINKNFQDWETAGVDPAEWVLYLLENRQGYEPQDDAHSLSINFHAHEILVSEAHLIRLIRAGYIEIAAESAKDSKTDFLAILNKMRNEPAAISRDIFAYTLIEYGEVRADLFGKAEICRREISGGIERTVLNMKHRASDGPDLLIIRPVANSETLDDAAVWGVIDATVPERGRGAVTNKWRREKSRQTFIKFANGVSVTFYGTGGEEGWLRASLASDIPFSFWGMQTPQMLIPNWI